VRVEIPFRHNLDGYDKNAGTRVLWPPALPVRPGRIPVSFTENINIIIPMKISCVQAEK